MHAAEYGTKPWVNPVLSKALEIKASSPPSRYTDPKVGLMSSGYVPDGWHWLAIGLKFVLDAQHALFGVALTALLWLVHGAAPHSARLPWLLVTY